jgi:5-methylcytosine-specific restriction protein A
VPIRANRPCKHAGCREIASDGRFCARHKVDPVALRPYDRWRGSPESRGYDADWRRVRKIALQRDRHLCQDCLAQKRLTPATEVHHEVPIDVDPSRRLDLTNLRSLCKPCHSAITATRDSSFARSRI